MRLSDLRLTDLTELRSGDLFADLRILDPPLIVPYPKNLPIQSTHFCNQDMKYIIDKDVNPMLEYMIGNNNAQIIKITNNIIEFKVKDSVLEMYGEDVLVGVDGNYPITRNGKVYLFYARNVKCNKLKSPKYYNKSIKRKSTKHKSTIIRKSNKQKSVRKSTKRK